MSSWNEGEGFAKGLATKRKLLMLTKRKQRYGGKERGDQGEEIGDDLEIAGNAHRRVGGFEWA